MKEYIRLELVGSGEVHKYLEDGWEIVETAKQSFPDGETRVDYHIGLPARVMVDKLMTVIRDYEEHGLKEKLFVGVAENFGENASEYEAGAGHSTPSKTARYMETYEKTVNDKNVNVRKKYTQEELQERAEFEF
jgi:hypothetical protein